MRTAPNERVERFRSSGPANASYGGFVLMCRGNRLRVIASDGLGWDHVSVSRPDRCPTWDEMAFVKKQFFHADETVMQLHVPEAAHINCHPFCLHLWRPQTQAQIAAVRAEWGDEWPYGELTSPGSIPLPPPETVGPSVAANAEDAA